MITLNLVQKYSYRINGDLNRYIRLKRLKKCSPILKYLSTNSNADSSAKTNDDEKIPVHYITRKGDKITVYGTEGDNLMHLAQRNSLDVEGACDASLACSTCHLYVNESYFDKLSPASEEEEDLLDLAPFLKTNSRLGKNCYSIFNLKFIYFFTFKGCQIILTKNIADIEVTIPPATRNFYVDD